MTLKEVVPTELRTDEERLVQVERVALTGVLSELVERAAEFDKTIALFDLV